VASPEVLRSPAGLFPQSRGSPFERPRASGTECSWRQLSEVVGMLIDRIEPAPATAKRKASQG
jgi:hypothetical protein